MLGLLIALSVLLVVSLGLGKIAARLRQPSILGELLAGVIVGPSLLGHFLPAAYRWMYGPSGAFSGFSTGLNTLGGIFFLLLAGLEMDRRAWSGLGRTVFSVSLTGMIFPFAVGVLAMRSGLLGGGERGSWPLSYFYGTALSISALPVIARTLLDLDLLKTRIGRITIASVSIDDVLGWIAFSMLLSLARGGAFSWVQALMAFGLTLSFSAFMVILAPLAFGRLIELTGQAGSPPLFPVIISVLLASAATEWIGIHALFGAMLGGIAWSRVPGVGSMIREKVNGFVFSFFAPIFFASLGLKADFVIHFHPMLVLMTVLIATFGKVTGCGLGCLLGGLDTRESLAVGLCMNARGAMELILSAIALEEHLIGLDIYVSLAVMALVTSAMVGPIMARLPLRRGPAGSAPENPGAPARAA